MDPVYEDDLPGLLAKDLNAYFEVFDTFYRKWLFQVCWQLVGNPDDAEDLTQETMKAMFVILQKKTAEQIEQMKLRGYLKTTAIHCHFNNCRKKKRQLPEVSLDMAEYRARVEDILDDLFFEQPESALERKESDQRVEALLRELPPEYRVAVWFKHIEGFNVAEIGRGLGVSRYLAGECLRKGMRLLRRLALSPGYRQSSCIE